MSDLMTAEVEQTKLLANALDRTSTACITVGVITPLAGFLYDIASFSTLSHGRLTFYVVYWLMGGGYYIISKTDLAEALEMTFWDYYNIGIPTLLVLIGYIAMRLHERDLDRKIRQRRQQHPGE